MCNLSDSRHGLYAVLTNFFQRLNVKLRVTQAIVKMWFCVNDYQDVIAY